MNGATTFYRLIERYGKVEIPVIQRDYAQGRASQRIIRDDFTKALYEALCLAPGSDGVPLDLDFVYGNVVDGAFQPLDGQQRLTTLFLLHWYLAWADGDGADFRAKIIANGRSRFGYSVRPGSRDFVDSLAGYGPDVRAADCPDVVDLITDQPWYYRRWRFDPTICSALSVLSRMHDVFGQTTGLYSRLIDETAPAITFQLLDLEQFDLSDDLYIKMNARGKQLTPFETFKARFERHLEDQQFVGIHHPLFGEYEPPSEVFKRRIDARWSDFFWPFRNPSSATFDDAVMNLLRFVIMITRDPESGEASKDLAELRMSARSSSYAWFHDRGWLDGELVLTLITLLERWSAGREELSCYLPDTRYIDERESFGVLTTRPTALSYEQLVRMFGYVQYLCCSAGDVDGGTFNSWMRVVSNLSTNTDYNRPDDLLRSFAGLRDLVPCMHHIVRHLAGPDCELRGFFRRQMAEERVKARLLELGEGWPERIDRAEQHSYFQGQIGFLLGFSGLDLSQPEAECMRLDSMAARACAIRFDHYFACAEQMFEDLEGDPYGAGRLWERALLSVGNFLLPNRGSYSLLVLSQDFVWSWKRLLRDAAPGRGGGAVLKGLWDRLEEPACFEGDLLEVIASASDLEPWQEAIIGTPTAYEYGRHKMIRFWGGTVYLLRSLQMNGAHVELFIYCLHEELKAQAEPPSFVFSYWETTSTYEEPRLTMSWALEDEEVTFELRFEESERAYLLWLRDPQEPSSELRVVLEGEGMAELGFEEVEGYWTSVVERAEIKHAVEVLDKGLAQGR